MKVACSWRLIVFAPAVIGAVLAFGCANPQAPRANAGATTSNVVVKKPKGGSGGATAQLVLAPKGTDLSSKSWTKGVGAKLAPLNQ
ncbi:MAG: hypothetical protein KGJ62_04490 [Armatimonadetes bacterium]|nr:hypothetical protein [Armatimonadota bacterium]MDE2205542.1 hypothetical protein [Armatimonadota bacterium]